MYFMFSHYFKKAQKKYELKICIIDINAIEKYHQVRCPNLKPTQPNFYVYSFSEWCLAFLDK